ncbi:hypothetical protein FNP_0902 [Fusobacterium polymorphum ATCC 10953]|uniref:Uncharacterized protein n=1 Tax=Fusobacterium polymorphum ATCC 10953 TaxID=393480 RepID=A5TUX7_FUSNP|nr:hypothetical protein FNP_0902 [Fusobacterium polymorphum ATCC 10953]
MKVLAYLMISKIIKIVKLKKKLVTLKIVEQKKL